MGNFAENLNLGNRFRPPLKSEEIMGKGVNVLCWVADQMTYVKSKKGKVSSLDFLPGMDYFLWNPGLAKENVNSG